MTQNQQDDLYVVGEGTPSGIVKIGRSGNVKVRLPGIQTGNPAKLQILHLEPGAGHFEVPLHNRFADIRLEGEWFDFGNEDPLVCVVAAIKELMLARFCTQGEMDRAVADARSQARDEALAEVESRLDARIRQQRDELIRERDQMIRREHARVAGERDRYWRARTAELQVQYAKQQDEWAAQVLTLQQQMVAFAEARKVPQTEAEFQELAKYIQDLYDAHAEEIAPELVDYITGSTKEEIDASFRQAIGTTSAILKSIAEARKAASNPVADPGLFKQLVDQAFVPKMPVRRIVPESAA